MSSTTTYISIKRCFVTPVPTAAQVQQLWPRTDTSYTLFSTDSTHAFLPKSPSAVPSVLPMPPPLQLWPPDRKAAILGFKVATLA